MNLFNAVMVYILCWWMVLFCVLPLNIKTINKPTHGEMPGAPVNPDLKRKAIITTVIAAGVWLVIYLIVRSDIISFHDIAEKMSM